MAELGFKTLDEAIGQVELLNTKKAVEHWKASGLDLAPLLIAPVNKSSRKNSTTQDHGLSGAMDNQLIELAKAALEKTTPVKIELPVRNVNRTVGTMLGAEISRRFGGVGLPADTIELKLHGSAGQSLGAFIPSGLTIKLFGDSNDYVAKGLSGGRVIIRPDERSKFASNENVIAGNVIGYGATSGEIFISGVVGERFCVRNSGAIAVVEGVGDHGCEYMTGGTVVVLGKTGRNFAAGMSGGRAFVLDLDQKLINPEMVDVIAIPADQDQKLHELIKLFFKETDSKIAKELLADWSAAKNRISLVMPRDYARVLDIMSKAEREGLPIESAVMAAING